MKRKQLLTKTFLIAAMLFVGMSVWAETVGESDNSTTGSKSTPISISSGNSIHYVFTSTRNTSANGNGWVLYVNNGNSDIIKLRNDIWEEVAETQTGTTSEFNWDTYATDMNGSTVDMTISLYNSMLMMRSIITTSDGSKTFHYNYSKALSSTPASLSISLMANYAYLDITIADKYTTGVGIKNVFIGTDNGDNTVTAEDFESASSLSSSWSNGGYNSVEIGNVTNVALPAVGSSVGETVPTYVSGNTMKRYQRQGTNTGLIYASYTMDSKVEKGILVFSSDFFASDYKSNAIYFRFVDESGNPVLTLNNNGGDNTKKFRYAIGTNSDVETDASSKWRTYNSFRIQDFVMDVETGATCFTLDYIDESGIRTQKTISLNVGTGKDVKSIQVGRYCVSKTDINTHMDNIKLFSVEPKYSYAINYTNGGSIIATDEGLDFVGATINASAEKNINDVIYVPKSGETTSFTVSVAASTNVWNVEMVGSAPYTINYKYNGSAIDSENGNAEVGTAVDATYPVSLWKDDVKYYIKDGEATTFDITGGTNTFDIDLRLAATDAVATINAKSDGTTVKTFTSAEGVEGEAVTVYFTHVAYDSANDKYYVTSDTDYGKALTYGSSTDVNYILDETIVYYSEIEDLNSDDAATGNYSGGKYSVPAPTTAYDLGTFPAAVYEVEGYNTVTSFAWRGLFLRKANSASEESVIIGLTAQTNGIMSGEFTLPTEMTVYYTGYTNAQGKINRGAELDYLIIRKTGVVATIGETGWTSFASPYALDLSGIDGGTAYYASSVGEESITMTTTDATVPAGEGLLLKGTAGATVTIPVAASGTAIEGNKLVGCTSAFEITANTAGYEGFYVLASNEGKAEFQNIKNWVETDNHTVTIPAGKAYIDASRTGSARSLSIVFEEEAVTGVNSVQGSGSKVNGYYDLQGRRVSQPTKGLYIMDGKKIIIK